MTIDEELTVLESQLRRLKIEYEVYFSNPTKRPPTDIEWKVLSLLRKFSDGGRMNFSQRYRYNEMAQRYAVYSDLGARKAASAKKAIAVRKMRCSPSRACVSKNTNREHKVYGSGTCCRGSCGRTRQAVAENRAQSRAQELLPCIARRPRAEQEQGGNALQQLLRPPRKRPAEKRLRQHGYPCDLRPEEDRTIR